MYDENYLFFPEAKEVDKLLSVLNIQSHNQLHPDKLIKILGLLNLLSLISNNENSNFSNLSLNNNIDSKQIKNIINNLKNNEQNISSDNSLMSTVTNLLGNSNNESQLNPELLFKVLNLIKEIKPKESSSKSEEENNPVKSEPSQHLNPNQKQD